MNEIEKWREWYLNQFGEIRDSFKEFEQSNKLILSIFLSTKFKPGFDSHTGGILIDIGYNLENSDVVFTGATFSKNAAAMYISNSPIIFEHSNKNNVSKFLSAKLSHSKNSETTIRLKGKQNKLSESVDGFIKYKIDNDIFELIDFKIRLLFWKQNEKSYIPVKTWNINDYKSEKFKVLCNRCFGQGFYKSMSIPEVDRNSGLSGYALYSCNTINATFGCKDCGGHGEEYAKWYLDENPKLKESTSKLVNGSGLVRCSDNVTKMHLKANKAIN